MRIEADHGKLKRFIKPMLGFKATNTAYATLMHALRNGQANPWCHEDSELGKIRLVL